MSAYDPSRPSTAWRGLERFAWWLVQTLDPKLTVELGCDEGYSAIELARYNRGSVHTLDWFQGDQHAGWADKEAIAFANVRDSGFTNIRIRKGKFEDLIHEYTDGSIDLLHVDGVHDYESVSRDFNAWSRRVRPGGVIIMHDTRSFPNDVGRLYHEIDWPKFEIPECSGLGVITKP